ncbi:PsiF family protein [Labrys wisconsinensis]|uniref:PsiF repeat-containing protein n=1 Tax=Labrys wisconsinensis TaxID=425677 RepID=A0ABU0JBD5_9HYPH|nr:PsiF family protein [Labrys wisconsinensis]MDQ0470728.1 hypothetical protein [Labrys wisconsinensis]
MTSLKTTALAAAFAFLVGTSLSFAQTTPAPTTPAPATPAPATTPMKATSTKKAAMSKECYAEATKQNLHGKARKKFHAECMKKATM